VQQKTWVDTRGDPVTHRIPHLKRECSSYTSNVLLQVGGVNRTMLLTVRGMKDVYTDSQTHVLIYEPGRLADMMAMNNHSNQEQLKCNH
jgi:hypothetical protein